MTGKRLKRERKALELTQAALARSLGVDKSTVARWEQGQREIPPYLHLALIGLEKTIGKQKTKSAT
jgi:transcriptional regulator with XRE-family HTH domain